MSEHKSKKPKLQNTLDSFLKPRPSPDTADVNPDISPAYECSLDVAESNEKPEQKQSSEFHQISFEGDPKILITKKLSDEERRSLLCSRWKPNDKSYIFPKNQQGRRYNIEWENNFTWLRYSPSLDGAFCAYCIAFSSSNASGEFISKPFQDWKNATGEKRGMLVGHDRSEKHKLAMEMSSNFLMCVEENKPDIKEHLSTAYKEAVEGNRAALNSIIDIIILLAKRNITFRGKWIKERQTEDGNFRYFVDWKSDFDSDLKKHLQSNKKAKYLSPAIQNEFIQCCEAEVRENIKLRMELSSFFSIMADETTDVSNESQLSLCVRYVDWNGKYPVVAEDFIGFVSLKRNNAETITTAILETLQTKWQLDMTKLRGHGYDGCSTMSGHVSGVKTRIAEEFPNARYFVHCRSHKLNLVVANSCQKVPIIKNIIAILGKLTYYLCGSAKRKNIMKETVKEGSDKNFNFDVLEEREESVFSSGAGRKCMPTLCETRWSSRIDTLTWLLRNYGSVVEAFDRIIDESSGQSAADGMSYRTEILSFQFVMAVVCTQFILGYFMPLTNVLQAEKCDLVFAHEESQSLTSVLQELRNDVDEQFHKLYLRACQIAQEFDVQPQRPRVARLQRHRANAPAGNIEDHYKINMFISFLDHCIQHMLDRFPPELITVLYGSYFVPSNVDKLTEDVLVEIKREFQNDLPSAEYFDQEVQRWRNLCGQNDNHNISGLVHTLCFIRKEFYPNISTILELLCSIPVGTCSCERSFSALRRLKTWQRGSMSGDRLCGLAMLFVHRDDSVSNIKTTDILKRWSRMTDRDILLAFEEDSDTDEN